MIQNATHTDIKQDNFKGVRTRGESSMNFLLVFISFYYKLVGI